MGDFDWDLNFAWSEIPYDGVYQNGRISNINAIPTPIVPLGVFAIHQSWFWKIGFFDLGMEIWGAENLEISFRIEVQGFSRYVGQVSKGKVSKNP